MKKVLNIEKEIIAALRLSGRSIDSLIEQYQVSEKQIESYVEQYKDSTRFEVTDYYTDQIDWEKVKVRTDLTEEFIMQNHEDLIEYGEDILESRADFIKKQMTVPQIRVDKNDYEFFKYNLEPIEEVIFDSVETNMSKLVCYPVLEDFQNGKLIYRIPLKRLYIKKSILQKRGFKINSDNGISLYVTNPEKIYKGDRLLFYIKDDDKYEIDNTKKIVTLNKSNGDIKTKPFIGKIRTIYKDGKDGIYDQNKRLVIKEGTLSLKRILKNNNLSKKKDRSVIFDTWLKENGYI